MTPEQISRLITEDPDVINEDVSTLAREIMRVISRGMFLQEPRKKYVTFSVEKNEDTPELNKYIDEDNLHMSGFTREVTSIYGPREIHITLKDGGWKHGRIFATILNDDELEAATRAAEAVIARFGAK
jgi:hypothetical protein